MPMQTIYEALGNGLFRPGSKLPCPACGENKLWIKKNEQIAICYGCEKKFYPRPEYKRAWITTLLGRLFADWQPQLWNSNTTMAYLTDTRRIHRTVVRHSNIGRVPFGYNLYDAEQAARQQIESEARFYEAKGDAYDKREELELLVKAMEKLVALVGDGKTGKGSAEGWLAFFYNDRRGGFVSINFRLPDAEKKAFQNFPPLAGTRAGIFNSHLASSDEDYTLPAWKDILTDDRLLVFEGEFNQLQWLSLLARIAEKQGIEPQRLYTWSCALGSASHPDLRTVAKLSKEPILCYDHDEAGRSVLEKLREVSFGLAVTTPTVGSDIDSYVRQFGDDYDAAARAIVTMLSKAEIICQSIDGVKSEVDSLRRNDEGRKGFEVEEAVMERVWQDLNQRGRIYTDGVVGYVFLREDKRLLEVRETPEFLLLLSKYGILPEGKLAKQAWKLFGLRALERGESSTIYRLAHYSVDTNCVYVSLGEGKVAKITANSFVQTDNGTDGVLFLNRKQEPFQIDLGKLPACSYGLLVDDGVLCRELNGKFEVGDGQLTPEDYQQLYLAKFLSLFLPELITKKPLVTLLGVQGSGKTTLGEKVGWLLEGSTFEPTLLSDDQKDFEAALTNNFFVLLDNVDDAKAKSKQDTVAVAATGGAVRRRALYTTNDEVEFPITAHLYISSRTPPFVRPDVADRMLLFPMERYGKSDGQLERVIKTTFLANRNAMMGEVILRLQKILQGLEAERGNRYPSEFRMREFADFCLRLAHHEKWEERMSKILDATGQSQKAFATENDPVVETITLWLGHNPTKNMRREVSISELNKELSEIGGRAGIDFPWVGNPRWFGQVLNGMRNILQERFGMQARLDRHSKSRFISFNPPKDAIKVIIAEARRRHSQGDVEPLPEWVT